MTEASEQEPTNIISMKDIDGADLAAEAEAKERQPLKIKLSLRE